MKRAAKRTGRWLTAVGTAMVFAGSGVADALEREAFDRLHGMVVTQEGESLFWGLPWMIQLDAALERGAAEGKPVFVWCGAGGAPVGVC